MQMKSQPVYTQAGITYYKNVQLQKACDFEFRGM